MYYLCASYMIFIFKNKIWFKKKTKIFSALIRDYDVALYRLKCYEDDVYCGITPNVNALDFNPEPPVFACRFCTTEGYEQIIALANEDGKIALQDTNIKSMSNQPLEGTQVLSISCIKITYIENCNEINTNYRLFE